jgi:hypothetical protein
MIRRDSVNKVFRGRQIPGSTKAEVVPPPYVSRLVKFGKPIDIRTCPFDPAPHLRLLRAERLTTAVDHLSEDPMVYTWT